MVSPVSLLIILVDWPIKTPIETTEPSPTITPSTISDLAPIKQLSSMIVGLACIGSNTPPIPTPPERWQFFPTCAHEPTVTQVSTMVPSSTNAPIFINDGMTTTFLPTCDPWRITAFGTILNPASKCCSLPQPAVLPFTLSHQVA